MTAIEKPMRVSFLILALAMTVPAAAQEKPAPRFDPFADPIAEMTRRVEKAAREKRFNELKAAASELAELSKKISEQIENGGQDVVSIKVLEDLEKAEKLIKEVREKAK
jgi:hypothetical protein